MAIWYVDDSAGGSNDGSDWTNAFTSFDSAMTASALAAGDFVYVADTHDETGSLAIPGNVSWALPNNNALPVIVISCTPQSDGVSGVYSEGAAVEVSAASSQDELEGSFCIYGMSLAFDNRLVTGTSEDNATMTFQGGSLTMGSSSDGFRIGSNTRARFIDWDFTGNNSTAQFRNEADSHVEVFGGAWGGTVNELIQPRGGYTEIRGVDFSSYTGTLLDLSGPSNTTSPRCYLASCVLNAGVTLVDQSFTDALTQYVRIDNCESGTTTDPAVESTSYAHRGSASVDEARYRVGGASDGVRTNPISLAMTALGGLTLELYEPIYSDWFVAWTDGDGSTSHTYTLYIAHDSIGDGTGGRLHDDQAWMELMVPNSGAQDSRQEYLDTKPDPLSTPANVPDDASSTWVEDFSSPNFQQLQITHTPDKPGIVMARLAFAPGDLSGTQTVYVDPQIVVG